MYGNNNIWTDKNKIKQNVSTAFNSYRLKSPDALAIKDPQQFQGMWNQLRENAFRTYGVDIGDMPAQQTP